MHNSDLKTSIKLTVVVPVYNEEQGIAHFFNETRAVLDTIPNVNAEILFVVDRCTDNTLLILKNLVAQNTKIRVLALSSRFGHQMSLLAGVENCRDADVIIMMDSDLQHPPELIPQLLAEYYKGAAVVYTVRKHTEGGSRLRRGIGSFFYYLLSVLSPIPINPHASDFRLINKQVADSLRNDFQERAMFLRGLFSWIGFNQIGISYVAKPRLAGKSKYSLTNMFKLAVTGILSFSTRPLYISIFMGIGFASFAFLFMLTAVINFFVDHHIPSGWTTLIIMLLLFSGVQLIVMGIIGSYIGGIYEEVKARPRYIIDEEIKSS